MTRLSKVHRGRVGDSATSPHYSEVVGACSAQLSLPDYMLAASGVTVTCLQPEDWELSPPRGFKKDTLICDGFIGEYGLHQSPFVQFFRSVRAFTDCIQKPSTLI